MSPAPAQSRTRGARRRRPGARARSVALPPSDATPRRSARPARAVEASRLSDAAPGTTYTMHRLDEVRALTHPLRIKLLELFAAQPRTTKQAAEIPGENPTRLYQHVNVPERV